MRVKHFISLAGTWSSVIKLESLSSASNVVLRLIIPRDTLAYVSIHSVTQMVYVHSFQLTSGFIFLILIVRTFYGWVQEKLRPIEVRFLHAFGTSD